MVPCIEAYVGATCLFGEASSGAPEGLSAVKREAGGATLAGPTTGFASDGPPVSSRDVLKQYISIQNVPI